MHVHEFIDEIYRAEVWFFYRCSVEDVEAHLKKKLGASCPSLNWDWRYDGGRATIENEAQKRMIYILWVRNKRSFYTLVHECFHLACAIFRDRGVLLDFRQSGTEEHFAYYQDALVKGMWRLMNKDDGRK